MRETRDTEEVEERALSWSPFDHGVQNEEAGSLVSRASGRSAGASSCCTENAEKGEEERQL